jgi:hypothetical protein
MGELAAECSRGVRARAGGDPDVGSRCSGGGSGGVHRARTQQGRLEEGAVGLLRPGADRLAAWWPGQVAPERLAARQGPGEVAAGGTTASWRGRGWRRGSWRGCGWRRGSCLARRRTGREVEPAAEGEGPARRAGREGGPELGADGGRGRRLGADGGREAGGCGGGGSPRRLWLLLENLNLS